MRCLGFGVFVCDFYGNGLGLLGITLGGNTCEKLGDVRADGLRTVVKRNACRRKHLYETLLYESFGGLVRNMEVLKVAVFHLDIRRDGQCGDKLKRISSSALALYL